jgi:hypothetical protein
VRRERLSLGSSADREELARGLSRAPERPVAWCVVDWASEATTALTDLLVTNWGPGLCYEPGVPWADPTRPAVLPKPAVGRILRASTTRVWSSDNEVPDRERVMESLEHGCLPLQLTPTAPVRVGEAAGAAVRALLLRSDSSGSLGPLSDDELRSRLNVVAEAVATGQMERELSHRHG